jgi:Mn-dependent DtxR family transcriptional regulator
MKARIQESAENYLETILVLSKSGNVRAVDVAAELGFSKPSVSAAMKKLREQDRVVVATDGSILLTNTGRKIAETTYSRHILLKDWFVSLGVEPEIAADDACRVEHDLSEETVIALRAYIKEHSGIISEE